MSVNTKKKKEFSKLIVIFILSLTIFTVIFTMFMIWRTGDLSPLSYLIPAVFVETGACTSFYYDKAKKENLMKIQQNNIAQDESINNNDI